jgi:hypothetical protein
MGRSTLMEKFFEILIIALVLIMAFNSPSKGKDND